MRPLSLPCMHRLARTLLIILFGLLGVNTSLPAMADDIYVATASNFASTAKKLVQQFENQSGHRVILSIGSTGRHYAQIINGAPFDVFLAADVVRPAKLEASGHSLRGTRFTYAIGQLVLWSPRENFVDSKGEVLTDATFRHLATANPKLAPYGKAAQDTIQHLHLQSTLTPKLVFGENIGHAFHFIKTGSAELGFVSLAQVRSLEKSRRGSYWIVPPSHYPPLRQQAVQLKTGKAAHAFMTYLQSAPALALMTADGYRKPDSPAKD